MSIPSGYRIATKEELIAAGKSLKSKAYIDPDGNLVSYRTALNAAAREKGYRSESQRHSVRADKQEKTYRVTQQRVYRNAPLTYGAIADLRQSGDSASYFVIPVYDRSTGASMGWRQTQTFSPIGGEEDTQYAIDLLFAEGEYENVVAGALGNIVFISFR